ncbi:MAG: TonB-dependent receptor [Pseudomonadota bacterium]
MKQTFYPRAAAVGLLVLPAFVVLPQQVLAQGQGIVVEEVIATGTRSKARSVNDSPAPVDVINASEFTNQGDTDISNLIRNSVPSYNVNDQPISDAATLVRPANLRGLAPDHTLILVNGKRRHRASVITWLGNGISNGAQGPDAAAIPALALKSVEILRDGAAAQYGSDAIAGVMNFILKDSAEGGSVEARYGETGDGDGAQWAFAGNVGLPLGPNGFANLTLEYGESDPTSRSTQRTDAQTLIDNGYPGVPVPAMIWGRPIVEDDIKLFVNYGFDISDNAEIYGHGNYNSKTVDGGFFYRNPTNRGAVYSNDGGATMLVGDLRADMNDGNPCPVVAFGGDDGVTPDPVAFAEVVARDDCFAWQERIEGGFTPRFGGDVTDTSFLIGVRGETANEFSWDFSAYYGNNEADFFINNTVNASLPDSPRDFDPGTYEQEDTSLTADFGMPLSDSLFLGFGAEYRVEEFTIVPGQVESFTAGPLAEQGFSTSSNGFPGFPDVTSGSWDRSNVAAYVDAEWEATDNLLLQAAVRFEDFEDFGTTTNYKVGGNWRFTDNFGARMTVSTGFKAPTPGQSNASNTSTELTGGVLVNNGTIPPTNPVALEFGGKPLEPEESTNFTAGIYFSAGPIDVTVDYFYIEVDDRLNLSSEVVLTPEQIQELIDAGVPGAADLTQFRFFTNDFDTETSGFDVVASTSFDWLNGTTDVNFAFNHTQTDVVSFNEETIQAPRIRQIEETTPENRFTLTGNHNMGNWRFLGRVSYFDEWYDSFEFDVFGTDAVFDSEFLFDIEVAYNFNDRASILLGGNNVFDNKGQTTTEVNGLGFDTSTVLGNQYSQYTPFGISGAYWYGRFSYAY